MKWGGEERKGKERSGEERRREEMTYLDVLHVQQKIPLKNLNKIQEMIFFSYQLYGVSQECITIPAAKNSNRK